jgi:hypothetical protein
MRAVYARGADTAVQTYPVHLSVIGARAIVRWLAAIRAGKPQAQGAATLPRLAGLRAVALLWRPA